MHSSKEPRSLWSTSLIIATCTLALSISTIASTGASISLPTVGREFGTPQSELQWIISAYALTAGCLLVFMGRLADVYGRRKVFVAGSIWMVAFSIGCGFAQNIMSLDILRAMQGIGSAAMIPAAIGILANTFPPSTTRSVAFATFSAGAPVGAAIGSVIGGAVTQYTSSTWRGIYFVMAGLAVLPVLGGIFLIEKDVPSEEDDRRVDWLGAFLITSGLVLIVFVLSGGETAPQEWRTPYIIACLVLGVFLTVVFFCWQSYLERVRARSPTGNAPPPLVKSSLWTRANGKLAATMAIAFLNWSCFIAWAFWVVLYYQEYMNYSPMQTVLRQVPMTIVGILCNVVVIFLISRVPAVTIIVFSTALTGLAALLFAINDPNVTYWAYEFPAMVTSVMGADFVMATGSLYVAKVALPHEQSLAGALFQTMTQIGTAFGLTITTVIYDRVSSQKAQDLGADVSSHDLSIPPEAELKGYQAAQWGCLAFAGVSLVLAVSFLRGVGIVGHRKGDDDSRVGPGEEKMVDDSSERRSGTDALVAEVEKGAFHADSAPSKNRR